MIRRLLAYLRALNAPTLPSSWSIEDPGDERERDALLVRETIAQASNATETGGGK